jgi:hypothetical protein
MALFGSHGQKPGGDAIDVPSKAYVEMFPKWDLINDLLGGTTVMRAVGRKWLPAENRENAVNYDNRIARSFLYGAYRDTIQKLSAKPFSKPVAVAGKLSDRIESITENVDLRGSDMTQFARTIFEDGLKYGMGHILVDYPSDGASQSLYEERQSGTRPYFVRIAPHDLIGWRTEKQPDGSDKLIQIRFKEKSLEFKNEFGEEEVEYIRVISLNGWQLWRRTENDKNYKKVKEGSHTFGEIPLVSFYTMRKDFMVSDPPLEDLAWLNLAHWQSLSDQRNILRFARVGLLFASGFAPEEIEEGINIGPNSLVSSTNPEASLAYVEHSGEAIGAGEKDLKRLEERMEVLGLQPLVQTTGNSTATARAMDEARTHSNIQAWIRGLENCLDLAFEMAAKWVGEKLPSDFAVDIFNEFGITLSASEDIKSLLAMKQSGCISHETFIKEVKRRGVLSDEVVASDEIDAIGELEALELERYSSANDPVSLNQDDEKEK